MKRLAPGKPTFVLSASAMIAMLRDQPGASLVGATLNRTVISTVTWTEVVKESRPDGIDVEGMRKDLMRLGLVILPFIPKDADKAAKIWEEAKGFELSLADRGCLALASRLGLPALTTDPTWEKLSLGVQIRLLG